MNSADVWWPDSPDGDMTPILQASIDREVSMARHPAGKGLAMPTMLTAQDRCDQCGAAAVYRVTKTNPLDFCGHHFREHGENLILQGWTILVAPERPAA